MKSGATLSERRISSAGQAVLDQVENAYETVFGLMAADDQFFDDLELAYNQYRERTRKRPISPRDVKAAQRLFRDECRKAMSQAKRRTT